MQIATPSHVCVIGGGPAGLASAIAVTQAGLRVTVVDRATPPIDKACGEGLMPDSVAVLAQLGIAVPFDVGARFHGIQFSDSHSSVAATFPSGGGVGLRRLALHSLLLQRAEDLGVQCHWGARDVQVDGSRVTVDGRLISSDFVIGADGHNSAVRRVFGWDAATRVRRRYAFRRHYRIEPWSRYVELHWARGCQMYITPVGPDEVCVIAMSRNPQLRLESALTLFPALKSRLTDAPHSTRETGGLSISRQFKRVCGPGAALVGDASGSVDAITGEGLCLSFKQALALAGCLRSGSLDEYESEHRRLSRRPHAMGMLMLTLDSHVAFQRRALAGLASCPKIFSSLLSVHVGDGSILDLLSWQLVDFCRGFLTA